MTHHPMRRGEWMELGWRRAGRPVWPNCTLRFVQANDSLQRYHQRYRRAMQDEDEIADEGEITAADLEDFMGIIQTVGEVLFRALHGSEALDELEPPTIEARFTTKQ